MMYDMMYDIQLQFGGEERGERDALYERKLQWVAHRARRGEEGLAWKRMVRENEDGKSKWGTRLKEDWKELGVKSTRGWCNKVKDKGWLASKLGKSKKKGKGKKKD